MFRKPNDPPPSFVLPNPFGTVTTNNPPTQGNPNPLTAQATANPPSVFGAPFQQTPSAPTITSTPVPSVFGQSSTFGCGVDGQTTFGGFGAPKPAPESSAPSLTLQGSSLFGQAHSFGGNQGLQAGSTTSSPLFGQKSVFHKSLFGNAEPVEKSEPVTKSPSGGQRSTAGSFVSLPAKQDVSTTSVFCGSSQPEQGSFASLLSKSEGSSPLAFGTAATSQRQSIFGNTSPLGTAASNPSQGIFAGQQAGQTPSSGPRSAGLASTQQQSIFGGAPFGSSIFRGSVSDANKQDASSTSTSVTSQQQQSIFAEGSSDVFTTATPGAQTNPTPFVRAAEGKQATKSMESQYTIPLFPIQPSFTSSPRLPSTPTKVVSATRTESGRPSEGSRKRDRVTQSLLSRALTGVVESEKRKKEDSKVVASQEEISTLTTLKCNHVPPELNDRETLLEHFTQFGPVERVVCQSRKNCATIKFRDHHSAEIAKKRGARLSKLFPPLEIFWCSTRKLSSDGGREEPRGVSVEQEKEEIDMTEPHILERPDEAALKRPAPPRRPSGSSRSSSLLAKLSKPRVASAKAILQRKAKPSEEEADVGPTKAPATQDEPHLLAILNQTAHTVGERYRALDARDKVIRLHMQKQSDIVTARATRGCCPDMCPEKERYSRTDKKCLSPFEVLPGSDGVMDPTRMVKEYSRSSADQEEPLPHELRPPAVLSFTMDYLMARIMNTQDNVSVGDWYDFIWNRTRAIRKDITQQHLCDQTSVSLVEKCARFHIHCAAVLVDEDISTFDPKINDENLGKCLQTLKHMYYDLSLRGERCPNEPEFRAYDVLLHLNEGDVVWQVQQLPEEVRRSREVSLAVTASEALNCRNYVRFFRVVLQAPYLFSCLLHRYFAQVRMQAFQTLLKACRQTGQKEEIPLATLVQQLGFEDASEARDFAACSGIGADEQSLFLARSLQTDRSVPREGTPDIVYSSRQGWMQKGRSKILVENKRTCSVGEVVNGGPLPDNPCENYQPHDSFMVDGTLRPAAYDASDQAAKCWGKPSAEAPEQKAIAPVVVVGQPAPVARTAPTYSNEVVKDVARDIINEEIVEQARSLSREEVLTQWSYNILAALLDESTAALMGNVCREAYLSAKEQRLQEILLAKQQAREDERRSQATVAEELNAEVVKEVSYEVSRSCHSAAMEELRRRQSEVILETLLKDVVTQETQDVAAVTVGIEKARYEECLSKARDFDTLRLLRSCFKLWLKYRAEQKAQRLARETFPSIPNLNFDLRNPELGLSTKRQRIAPDVWDGATKCLNAAVVLKTLREELEYTPVDIPRLLTSVRRTFRFPFKLLVSLPTGTRARFDEPSAKVLSKLGFGSWPPFQNGEKVARIFSGEDQSIPFCITAIEQLPADEDVDHAGRPRVLLGTSAVLFVLSSSQEGSSRRLEELLCSLSTLNPVPPVCLLDVSRLHERRDVNQESSSEAALNLDALRCRGQLPEKFHVVSSDTKCRHTLGQMVEAAVKWCAESLPDVPGLCTEYLRDFIENGVGRFVFDVVYADLFVLRSSPEFPRLVVELYNEALQHLAAVVASESIAGLTVAATELKVPGYDDHWNNPQHLLHMRDVLLSLRLPPVEGDSDDVNTVWKYVNSLFGTLGSGRDHLVLVTSIREALKHHHGVYAKRHIPWADIIHDCFCHLLLGQSFHDDMTEEEYVIHYLQQELDSFEIPPFWQEALHWASPVRRAVRQEQVWDAFKTEPMEAKATEVAEAAPSIEASAEDAVLSKFEALLERQTAESTLFTARLKELVCDETPFECSRVDSTPSPEKCALNTSSVDAFYDLADAVDALNARIETNRKLNESLHQVVDLALKT